MAKFNTTFTISSENINTKIENYIEIDKTSDIYTGEYEVIPKAYQKQTLATKNKVLTENITVLEVPFFKVDNTFGQTVFIAKGEI